MPEGAPDPNDPIAEEARSWVVRMASGAMDGDELARFKAWREEQPEHNIAFECQRRMWRAVGPAPSFQPRVPARHSSHQTRRWYRRHTGMVTAATAAVAAALVLAGPDLGVMMRADHRAGDTVERVALPDGSIAMLDAGSAIAVSYGQGERRVELLRGDAWFHVVHGDQRPFRVAALGGVTQDVGTAFEVDLQDEAVTVSVTEGQVKVIGTVGAALLSATHRARYWQGGAPTRLDDAAVADIAPWRNGELLLRDENVRTAIARIGRYHRGPVYVLGSVVGVRRLSGAFRTDRPDEAIDAIASMTHMKVYRFAGITILRPAN